MLFKNTAMFRFTVASAAAIITRDLSDKLAEHEFPGIGPQDAARLGFAPALFGGQEFVHSVNGCHLMRLRKDEKIMPAAGITREVQERVDLIEVEHGRKVGRKEKLEIRDQVILERLPTAFVKTTYTAGYIDETLGLLIVDGTWRQAEEFCSALRQATGTLPVRPVFVNNSPSFVMTATLEHGDTVLLEHFSLGEECTLTDTDGGKVTYKDMDLVAAVESHLEDGMSCISLRLARADRLAFTVDESLLVKKVKFLDDFMSALADVDSEDRLALQDTTFYLMTSEIRELFQGLMESFGGENKEAVVA